MALHQGATRHDLRSESAHDPVVAHDRHPVFDQSYLLVILSPTSIDVGQDEVFALYQSDQMQFKARVTFQPFTAHNVIADH